jgi:hypothetical protein
MRPGTTYERGALITSSGGIWRTVFQAFQVLTILLVTVAVTCTLAHALELPGKLRLSKEAYLAIQPIYYPGFTIAGGVGEAGGIIATLILTILMPYGAGFWLTLTALVALLCMHALYWILAHPVNNFWLQGFELKGAGKGFFSFDPIKRSGGSQPPDWTALRDRWEHSHVMRAVFALLGLTLLVTSAVAVK